MYYPYFRGREFELLAIKELVLNGKIDNKVIPIIEPVNENVKRLNDLITLLDKNQKNFIIIQNPQVGFFKGRIPTGIKKSHYLMEGRIINNGAKLKNINSSTDIVFLITNLSQNSVNKLSHYNFDIATSKSQHFQQKRRIILFEDKFHKQPTNTNYLNQTDEFFSSDNKIYKKIHAKGFGDYSIVGNKFQRSGGQAKEVSIHIVYLDKEDNIRVHHFTSKLGSGTSKLDKKIQVAITDFCNWYKNQPAKNHSTGADEIVKRLNKKVSLGKLKQYSIMHHLEIIENYL